MSGDLSTVETLRAALSQRFPQARPTAAAIHQHDRGDSRHAFSTGWLTEVVADVGAGGCSLVLKQLASLLKNHPERYGAFVDLSHQLYPPAAAALGIPLRRLLLLRPESVSLALKAVELLVSGGGIRMIALDLPAGTAPLRLSIAHRLRRLIRQRDVALVFLVRHTLTPADCRIELSVGDTQ